MRLDRDSIAYLNFHLPRHHPELFAALHRVVEEALNDLKDINHLPADLELYQVLLDFDVRPAQEIAEHKREAAALYVHLQRTVEGASVEATIDY